MVSLVLTFYKINEFAGLYTHPVALVTILHVIGLCDGETPAREREGVYGSAGYADARLIVVGHPQHPGYPKDWQGDAVAKKIAMAFYYPTE